MRVKLMTLGYSVALGGFDTTPLEDFTADKDLVAFREHFFTVGGVPHILCVVSWEGALAAEGPRRGGTVPGRRDRPDPREGMDGPERALYETLREWRSRKARAEGVPPYVILTNRELAAVVRARPESPTALGHVNGVGRAKVKRHGAEILAALNGHGAAAASAAPGQAVEPPEGEEPKPDAPAAPGAAS